MNKYFRVFGVATLLSIFVVMAFTACSNGNDNIAQSQKLTVMASTPIIADWVNQVGGERIEVKSIVPKGINPHGYQPGSKTLTEIASADAVFFVGLGYEGLWMTKLIENNDGIPFTTLGDVTEPI
ncbi:MAG: metal ABC transporter substrate-binding protein, partial [Dehalococcoidia bacterium]